MTIVLRDMEEDYIVGQSPTSLYNNTFYNNEAVMGGNSIGIHWGDMVMFNNIIWSDSKFCRCRFLF